MLNIFIFFERFAPQGDFDSLSDKHLKSRIYESKIALFLTKISNPVILYQCLASPQNICAEAHYSYEKRRDESMQQIDCTGFFAMLRMTKLTALAIKKLHTYDFSMTFVGELADLGI